MVRAFAVLALVALAACTHTPQVGRDLKGETLRVSSASYGRVWAATHGAVSDVLYVGNETNKQRGEIIGHGRGCAFGARADVVTVYITPASARAATYSIKIVADSERNSAEQALALRDDIVESLAAAGVRAEIISGAEAI